MLLSTATIQNLCSLVCSKGKVFQADLKAFDLVALLNNGKQLAACGLALRYVDTRVGYALSAINAK